MFPVMLRLAVKTNILVVADMRGYDDYETYMYLKWIHSITEFKIKYEYHRFKSIDQ